ncbi:MAG: nucleotide exchange factor GrpE, partial [bacterium]
TAAAEKVEDAENYRKMADDYLNTLKRVQADFENYKKRVRKEKADTIRYATEGLLTKLLGITDNLKRGADCATNLTNPNCLEDMIEGINLISKQFHDLFAEYGIVPYESVGAPFNPALHECICLTERDDLPENSVVEEFQTGYKIHDRVLRVAKVSVSKKPESQSDNSAPACEEIAGDKT